MEQLALKAENISKHFGGLQALNKVSIDVRKGEVHSLVGENGAGKSTLIKILGGIYQRDEGSIIFDGEDVHFSTPIEAINSGIAIIHQELSMMPHLNVMENVFMGKMPRKGFSIDWRKLEKETLEALALVNLDVDPYEKAGNLSISQRQLIEIAKALSTKASLIIMDEPNSSLTESETEVLFSVIENLKSKGIAILYVSHKIEEVLRISDRISACRDGQYVDTIERKNASVDKIISMMVGRELERTKVIRETSDEVLLDVKDLFSGHFNNISFQLKKGEILGFSGLVGAGRSEVVRAIFGADPYSGGSIIFDNEKLEVKSPKEAIDKGIAMVPEDRKKLSLFMDLPINSNISIAELPNMTRGPLIDHKRVWNNSAEFTKKLNIKLSSLDAPVKSLSGGNQQKTILGRWLSTNPKLLILDEPTHGVDIGAKSEIYNLIRKLADDGIGIILISSELPEIITMSDRVVVMHEGCITGVLEGDAINEEQIMSCATGCLAS